jgi:hypothetical protein
MNWPHDPDGEQGSEGRRKYGHAIIAKKVDEETDFPLQTEEFLTSHGQDPVRLAESKVVAVSDIFEYVQKSVFEDFIEFHQEIGQAMRDGGLWTYEAPERGIETEQV